MSTPIVLYHYWRSSCSWRVRWALELKNVKYKGVAVNLLNKEQSSRTHLRRNASGQVPCIEIAGRTFSESIAIIEWIDETYKGTPLLPQSAIDRMKVRELVNIVASGIQPLQNLKVQQFITKNTGYEGKEFANHWIADGFRSLERKLEELGAGTYCFGGQITIADLALIPQCYNALRFGIPLYRYPIIKSIYDRCLGTPECKTAAPENQPGAAS